MAQHTITETSAGGIVYRKTQEGFEWLIIQHSVAKHWGFPKGHVGDKIKEEKMEDAALREVEEEGGVKATIKDHKPFIIRYFYKLHNKLRKKTVYYFLMEYVSGDTSDHDTEVQEAKFVPEDKVFSFLTYENDKEAFRKAKERVAKITL